MPIGLQQGELNSYFRLPSSVFGKSIQRSYNFFSTFLDNPFTPRRPDLGPMPLVLPYHILSVTLPTYKFSKEVLIFGQVPVTFPVLNVDDAKELSVQVLLEEDELGTIEFFITWCQRNIIDNDGYYTAPLKNRIGHLIIEVDDPNGIPIVFYTLKSLYYLNASDVTYDYSTNESIKRTVTFGVDRVETLFTKYTAINMAQKGITSLLQPLANSTGLSNLI
jgi:hypothetical protein